MYIKLFQISFVQISFLILVSLTFHVINSVFSSEAVITSGVQKFHENEMRFHYVCLILPCTKTKL